MRSLLSEKGRRALLEHTRGGSLLGFDFDGTLAPIVQEPSQAELRPRTRALLREVAARIPCIVLSGRSRDDVRRRLIGIPVREVFGNHGMEPWFAPPILLRALKERRELLAERLSACPGVKIENKGYTLAIHYRQAADTIAAQQAIVAALAELRGVRILSGNMVYDVLPEGAAHKGTALAAAMQLLHADRALYVGDDATDEDIFTACDPGRVLGVHIGFSSKSHAAYYLHRQEEIDELLEMLLRAGN